MKSSLSKTVRSTFRLEERGVPEFKGTLFGIEIEMEGQVRVPDGKSANWRQERDGSLRGDGSREYVSRGAWDKKTAAAEILELYDNILKNKGTINNSMRAGVHIHLNMQDKTMMELFTFVALYYVLEDTLIDMFGTEERVGNLFCLRLSDASYTSEILATAIKSGAFAQYMTDNDEIRYSALNLTSLSKYGSVEFRALQTPQDPRQILSWIDIIELILKGSQKFKTPEEVLNHLSADGVDNTLDLIGLPQLKNVPDYNDKIQKSIWATQFWVFSNEWK